MPLPDHETHMAEVSDLAQQARETPNAPLGARPAPVGTIAPIFMGHDHETIPDRYVLHYSTTTCRNCGHVETCSDFFSLSYIRSRVNGTRVKHLIKCTSPLYNLPVDRLLTRNDYTPFCSSCPPIDLSHLPPPPEPSQLRTLPEPTLKGRGPKGAGERQVKEKAEKPKKLGNSLDDLI